jgi:hypothetical protein
MQAFRKVFPVAIGLAVMLAACLPAQSPQQVQDAIQTGVALTVQAQNDMATSVAATLTAQAPLPSATASPTLVPLVLPTLVLPVYTATPFVVTSGGGGGGGGSDPKRPYSCTFSEVKPRFNQIRTGDSFDIVWIITNTGTKNWTDPIEINFFSGTNFTNLTTAPMTMLKTGDRFTLSFDARAPNNPGFYEAKFKVSQGYCFPYIDIEAVRPPGLDP